MKFLQNLSPILSLILENSETTGLRSQGKIYIVILVVALVFIGIIIYLMALDFRIRKLEKKDH